MKNLWVEVLNNDGISDLDKKNVFFFLRGYLEGLPIELQKPIKNVVDDFVKSKIQNMAIDDCLQRIKWFGTKF